MNNAQLIAEAMEANGVTEESHTYARWKELGYTVRKGQHATFRCPIWKYHKKKKANEDEEVGTMFMKTASFFTRSQVDATA